MTIDIKIGYAVITLYHKQKYFMEHKMNDKQTAYYTVKEDEVRVDSPYNPIRHDAAEYLAKRLDVPVEDALVAGQKYIKQRMKRKLRLEGDRFYLIDTPINP